MQYQKKPRFQNEKFTSGQIISKHVGIRNKIESCRTVVNRILEKELGKEEYYLHLRLYPHHILREHALASGAGADRMSSGMARPFGKPVHIAAQIRKGQRDS